MEGDTSKTKSVVMLSLMSAALVIGYSPAYLTENADGTSLRLAALPPLDSKELLLASAALGCKIAALARHGVSVGSAGLAF
jgi:hypothetical protein